YRIRLVGEFSSKFVPYAEFCKGSLKTVLLFRLPFSTPNQHSFNPPPIYPAPVSPYHPPICSPQP
ncbi:hypothetical protein, partial [Kingella oralis]|uniref:hypothetical protein n=1 Tax=Kingella oralis TaxID=505 RepID=UPI0034E498B5